MIAPGTLFYFTPFHFNDGHTRSKNKYFLAMGEIAPPGQKENQIIIASLPSSQDHNPKDIDISHGCNNHPDRGLNCYHFDKGVIITNEGFLFPSKTYIWSLDYRFQFKFAHK